MRLLGPPLITTPRAVKRLTNSYGLLATIQRQTTESPSNPHAQSAHADAAAEVVDGAAMVLLAALIGSASGAILSKSEGGLSG